MRPSVCPERTGCPRSAVTCSTVPPSCAVTAASRSAASVPESVGPLDTSRVDTTSIASGPSTISAGPLATAASDSRPHAASTSTDAAAAARIPLFLIDRLR
jgi:hypothetical protein